MTEQIKVTSNGETHLFTIQKRDNAPFSGSEILFCLDQNGRKVVLKKSVFDWGAQREWLGLQKTNHLAFVQKGVLLGEMSDQTKVIVTELVPGKQLYKTDPLELRIELGKKLKSIHQHTTIQGDEWNKSQKSDLSYFERSLHLWCSPEIQRVLGLDTSLAMLKQLLQQATKLENVLPTFTHQDLHEGQVFVADNALGKIIDLEFWQEADPLEDLGIYLFHLLREETPTERFTALAQGYFDNEDFNQDTKIALSFYLLFAATRAAVFFQRQRKSYVPTALGTLNRVVSFLEEEELFKMR